MGVRGLATLARKRGGSTLETIDADTTLLIDGSGLCAHDAKPPEMRVWW